MVSIHARAERATLPYNPSDRPSSLFQSTHAQSVRHAVQSLYRPRLKFQSTHAQSVRLYLYTDYAQYCWVSIHARAERATLCQPYFGLRLFRFQSTHAQSVRRHTTRPTAAGAGFNPRTRRACDTFFDFCKPLAVVSIHARAERATTMLL